MMQKFRWGLLIIFLSSLLACSVSPNTESTGEFIDSATTTAKVKASLIDHLGTQSLSIQVKTFKDQVQLSGFVNTEHVKRQAGAIARDNPGVKGVINNIVVKK